MDYWKAIPEFEGYFIRDDGNVLSLKSYEPKLLKPHLNAIDGYYQVMLSKNNKVYPILVHRLVADIFLGNPNNYPCVNHIDGNKLNNHVSNLEWCTESYNVKHAYDNQLLMSPVAKKVQCINTGEVYNSITEAAKATGCTAYLISLCCKGERHKTKNLKWRFI